MRRERGGVELKHARRMVQKDKKKEKEEDASYSTQWLSAKCECAELRFNVVLRAWKHW